MIWTSKWRCPSERLAASRTTANASGSMSSSISTRSSFVSQCASRPRNSSVIARSASSERACISGSKAATSGTIDSTSLSFRPSPAWRSLLKRPMWSPSVPTDVATSRRARCRGGCRGSPPPSLSEAPSATSDARPLHASMRPWRRPSGRTRSSRSVRNRGSKSAGGNGSRRCGQASWWPSAWRCGRRPAPGGADRRTARTSCRISCGRTSRFPTSWPTGGSTAGSRASTSDTRSSYSTGPAWPGRWAPRVR